MTPSLSIRKAAMADAKAIAQHNRAMALETEGIDLDAGRTLAGVKAVIKDGHKGFYLVACRGGDPVGQLLITPEWSDWRNGWFWWIQSVYVAQNHRKQGIFRHLFYHLSELAATRRDVVGLRLYVDHSNRTAKSVYESLGMFPCGYDMYEISLQ